MTEYEYTHVIKTSLRHSHTQRVIIYFGFSFCIFLHCFSIFLSVYCFLSSFFLTRFTCHHTNFRPSALPSVQNLSLLKWVNSFCRSLGNYWLVLCLKGWGFYVCRHPGVSPERLHPGLSSWSGQCALGPLRAELNIAEFWFCILISCYWWIIAMENVLFNCFWSRNSPTRPFPDYTEASATAF